MPVVPPSTDGAVFPGTLDNLIGLPGCFMRNEWHMLNASVRCPEEEPEPDIWL